MPNDTNAGETSSGLTGSVAQLDFDRGRADLFREARRAAVLLAEGAIILALAWAFQIESPAFYRVVLPLGLVGALAHHWLPTQRRTLFFVGVSVAGILAVLGPGPGAWLLAVGLALIGLCHIPVPFRWRLVLIGGAAGLLLAMRSTWLPAPWPGVIWPVLASMFMFRLVLYLYELKHNGPAGVGFSLAYFFMLPNTVFLLFPVVDFRTFRRAYYDRPALDIYEEGVRWIFRGLTHLVLYRLIYRYVVMPPDAVMSTTDIARYLAGNYGLYLRVSGSFHVIVGLLHLYGFRLPETHRFFYVASSVSDLWRRINIYWKDFMQKVVYLPVFFGLKRRGESVALIGATVVVIVVTWFLHSYQWFWLLGRWLLNPVDMAFWGLLGLLLIGNTVWEQRRGRTRQLGSHTPAPRQAWRESLQAAGMFAVMCVLWGFWASPTVADFWGLRTAVTLRASDVAVVGGGLGALVAIAFLSRRFALGVPSEIARRRWWQHPVLSAAVPLAVLWFAGEPIAAGRLSPQLQTVALQARSTGLNEYDVERLTQGYYEDIVGVNRFNGELWQVYARAGSLPQPENELPEDDLDGFASSIITEPNPDPLLERVLRPSHQTLFKGGRFTTNRWGMRDRDYEKSPPPGTRRIAVLGPSYSMGSGVNDGETFEALIEDRLSGESAQRDGLGYEWLNFSVSGYTLLRQARLMSNGRVAEFHPDVILLVGSPRDDSMTLRDVARLASLKAPFPGRVARVVDLVRRDIDPANEGSIQEWRRRLRPHMDNLMRAIFTEMAAAARQMGASVVYAIIPVPADPQPTLAGAVPKLLSMAADAGFLVVDMQDVYGDRDPGTLILNESDHHPNAAGHRLIAARLYRVMDRLPPGILTPADAADADVRQRAWLEWNQAQLSGAQEGTPAAGQEAPADTGSRRARRRARAESTNARARGTAANGSRAAGPEDVPSNVATGGWALDVRGGDVATLQSIRKDDWMRVDFARTARAQEARVLVTAPVHVTAGTQYTLRFWLKGDANRPVACGVARSSLASLLGERKAFEAKRRWIAFTCPFTATASDTDARIFFDLGSSAVPIELTGIVLRDESQAQETAYLAPAGTGEQ